MYMKLSKAMKDDIKNSLKDYFYQERTEEMGDLGAENMLDFLIKEIGPHFYNQGVQDARQLIEQKMVNLEEDIRSLERPIRRR